MQQLSKIIYELEPRKTPKEIKRLMEHLKVGMNVGDHVKEFPVGTYFLVKCHPNSYFFGYDEKRCFNLWWVIEATDLPIPKPETAIQEILAAIPIQ